MYNSTSSIFLTLTYDDDHLPVSFNGLPTLQKADLQKFWKRLRKEYPPKTIKYYAIGEYGFEKDRPHYHAIVYNLCQRHILKPDELDGIWDKGIVDSRPINGNRLGYVTGYVMQGSWKPEHELDDRSKHFSASSQGLGKCYSDDQEIARHYRGTLQAHYYQERAKRKLPRYYMDKIFSPHEKKIIQNKLARKVEPLENRFDNANHMVQWIRDQDRKHALLLEKRRKA